MLRGRASGSLALLFVLSLASSQARSAEAAEKSWSVDLPLRGGSALAVENVLGSVEIRASQSEGRARVEVQVLAEGKTAEEAARLAASVRLDSQENGGARIRVVLPPDVESARLPGAGKNPVTRWAGSLFRRKTDVEVALGDRTVRVVTDRKAAAVAARLVVAVPFDTRVSVRQGVGSIRVAGTRGDFRLENRDGRVEVSQVFGAVAIEAGASDVGVTLFQGSDLDVRTDAGSVELREVRSRRIRLETEGGAVEGAAVSGDEMAIATGAGRVHFTGLEPKTAEIRSQSGSVDIAVRIAGMRRTSIDSTAGDVVLRVSHGLSFDLTARTPSGEVKTLGMPLETIERDGSRSRFRRGGGGPQFEVSAGRSLTVRPYDASRFDILVGDVHR